MSGSSSKQKPEILGTEELKTEAKWLKLERINWKDEEGKEVSFLLSASDHPIIVTMEWIQIADGS
jgi:hypothetical protein